MSYDPAKSKWAPQIKTYGEGAERGQRILIFGEAGVGKTTLAATWPKPWFIDLDLGETNEERDRQLRYITFPTKNVFVNVQRILTDFKNRQDVFDPDGGPLADRETVVIDTWTTINEYILADLAGAAIGSKTAIDLAMERASIQQYGFLATRQDALTTLIKEISMTGRNVVIICMSMVEGSEEEKKIAKPGELKTTFEEGIGIPNLVGKYKYKIGGCYDEQYYLRFADSGSTRVLHTQKYGIWRAKTRRRLPATIIDPTFDKIQNAAARQ